MRAILDLCVAMDTFSHRTYSAMSIACKDPDLAATFSRMAADEQSHIRWWQDLITAWEEGLVPDVVNDSDGLERHMHALLREMQETAPENYENVPTDVMLDIAARLEFFLLDPIFGELLDITEPGGAGKHREEYARHLERIVGAIQQHYSRPELASFLARVLRRAWRDNLALATFATRDPLTGIYNRRGLVSHLEQWLSWASRYERPLGVLLVDVDDFKKLNDTYGHTIADVALKTIAETLGDVVRGSDLVARYGGDEFAIVAPETDSRELLTLAERLASAVAEKQLNDWDGIRIPLGITVGGAVATRPGDSGSSIDGLLAAADRSLYEAKRSGKGRAGEMVDYTGQTPATHE